ncbi:MAG: DUF3530 family protein [Gammaproteobacteria bacterium]
MKLVVLALSLFVGVSPAFAQSPDLDRETRLKNQIVDAIFDGDPIELEAEGHPFLAIDMEAGEGNKGAAIILHGRGFHPDWASVIQPLRIGLTDWGWRTLSIQMPVLGKEAKYFDYVPIFPDAQPRITAAIDYLKEQGVSRIVLIAHSCGAHMAMHRFNTRGDDEFAAFVGIGMGATDYKQPMMEGYPMPQMSIPVLDIFGSEDYPAVLRMAPERKAGLKNVKSGQVVIQGAGHYFEDKATPLVEAIGQWLDNI